MKQEHTIKTGFFHHLALMLVLFTMIAQTLTPTMVTFMGVEYELGTTDIEQEFDEEEKLEDTVKNEEITLKTAHTYYKFGHQREATSYGIYLSCLLSNFYLEINSPPPDLG